MTRDRAVVALVAVVVAAAVVLAMTAARPADPVPILEQLCVEARAAHPDRGCP